MTETVAGFRGDYFFLSNFYESPIVIEFEGQPYTFATGEHAFQGMKVAAALHPEDNARQLRLLEKAPTPGKAKYWGRSIRIDATRWDAMSVRCMRRTLALKFGQHPTLTSRLLATGGTKLVEYNDWSDTLWGVDAATGRGENRLGVLLMELRTSLQLPR